MTTGTARLDAGLVVAAAARRRRIVLSNADRQWRVPCLKAVGLISLQADSPMSRFESAGDHSSQLPALGREVNGHSHRMFCSVHLAMSIYGSNHEQRIINVSYCMDSAIAPDRHSASARHLFW